MFENDIQPIFVASMYDVLEIQDGIYSGVSFTVSGILGTDSNPVYQLSSNSGFDILIFDPFEPVKIQNDALLTYNNLNINQKIQAKVYIVNKGSVSDCGQYGFHFNHNISPYLIQLRNMYLYSLKFF